MHVTQFKCDCCGKVYLELNEQDCARRMGYIQNVYNTINVGENAIELDLEIKSDGGQTYSELCPDCRIKWLDKALRQMKNSSAELEATRVKETIGVEKSTFIGTLIDKVTG